MAIDVHLAGLHKGRLSSANDENVIFDNSSAFTVVNFQRGHDTLDFRPFLGPSEHLGQNVFIGHLAPESIFGALHNDGRLVYLQGPDAIPPGVHHITESEYKIYEVFDQSAGSGFHPAVKLIGVLSVDHATLVGATDAILAH